MGKWTLIHSAGSAQEAELLRGLLESHGINAVILGDRSNPYPPLNEARIYVERDDVVRALYIVHKDHGG